MKRILVALSLMILVFSACDKDDDNDHEEHLRLEEIADMKDRIESMQPNFSEIEKQVFIVTTKMESISVVFNSIARNPPEAEKIILIAKNGSYENINDMMSDINGARDLIANYKSVVAHFQTLSGDKSQAEKYMRFVTMYENQINQRIGRSRGMQIGQLINSVARNPDAYDLLEGAAAIFIGDADEFYVNPEIMEYAKLFAMPSIYEDLGRQPEAYDKFVLLAKKYLKIDI